MVQGIACAHIRNMRQSLTAPTGDLKMIESTKPQFELRFQSLFDAGRGFSFPCGPTGQVDLDGLSERARNNYFYARAMVGRELAVPALRPSHLH